MGTATLTDQSSTPKTCYKVQDLVERGWSDAMIKRFLGSEDTRVPVEHYANFSGARVWFLARIEAAESTVEFEDYFKKSAQRRKLDKGFVRDVLTRLSALRASQSDDVKPDSTRSEEKNQDSDSHSTDSTSTPQKKSRARMAQADLSPVQPGSPHSAEEVRMRLAKLWGAKPEQVKFWQE